MTGAQARTIPLARKKKKQTLTRMRFFVDLATYPITINPVVAVNSADKTRPAWRENPKISIQAA